MANSWGKWKQWQIFFSGLQYHFRLWLKPWNSKIPALWKKCYDKPRQHIKKYRHYFANKGPSSQSYGFSSSHVWMWDMDHKESWAPKNWCFWTVVLEKTLESPLESKEIQLVHPKGHQSWVFIGRTDEAETPILWLPDVRNWLIGKDPDAWDDWRQEEKGTTENEIVGWMSSPTPGAYSDSCLLSRWCHPTISSSVVPFSSCPQSFPASESFQMS